MANRPVNTGSGGTAAPPPVHHDAILPAPGATPAAPGATRAAPAATPAAASRNPAAASRNPAGHRAARPARAARPPNPGGLGWLAYLVVLAGVAAGIFVIWQGSKYAGRGSAIVGCSLLAGALARLILPPRYAGLLSSRRKASDVLAFAVFGAAVLAVAIALP